MAACPGLATAANDRAAALCVLNDFAKNYVYDATARLAAVPDPLQIFMEQRRGFCIHFASAAALMLRACGIPTRLVGGFVSYEYAPWLRNWVVREHHGHAWVEAWDHDTRRWFLVEATPASGLPAQTLVGAWRRACDLIVASWQRLQHWGDQLAPLQRLANATTQVWQWLSQRWPVIATVLLIAILVIWRRQRRRLQRQSLDLQLRTELGITAEAVARRYAGAAQIRHAHESWAHWLQRIKMYLPPQKHRHLCLIFEAYQQIRYSRHLDVAAARTWIRANRH